MKQIINFLKKQKSSNIITCALIFFAVSFFIGFGLVHLTKFETTDEHFWKYDRIEKYYHGIEEGFKEGDWGKTRLNDKPGVTVALINGVTVPFGLEPGKHENVVAEKANRFFDKDSEKLRKLYDIYYVEDTEKINFYLRLPGLLFNALVILPLIFWLTLKLTRSKFLSALAVFLTGTSPVLLGISQIINPDTFLWGFSSVAILAYSAYLYRKERRFLIIAGVATGFSLLSKYTANLLFLFYPILFVLYSFFNHKKETSFKEVLLSNNSKKYVLSFIAISIIAFVVFSIFLPQVLLERRHFLYGTIYSPTLAPIMDIFIDLFGVRENIFYTASRYKTILLFPFVSVVFGFVTIVLPVLFLAIMKSFRKSFDWILKAGLAFMIFIFLFSLVNAWSDTPFFSLKNIKEESRVDGELLFPDFASDPAPMFWLKGFAVEAQNLIFSVTPIVFVAVLFLWILVLRGKLRSKKLLPVIYLFSFFAPVVFFAGALSADIFVNIRYSIMLFPMFAFLGALGVYEFFKIIVDKYSLKEKNIEYFKYGIAFLVLILGFLSLWSVKPYYFNYHSSFLPKEYLVTDAWGYGSYEAAMYLNSLPDSENIVAWTDHEAVCQFFEGKCVISKDIYLDGTDVDYFVFSRRGSLITSFYPEGDNPLGISSSKYHSKKFIEKNKVFEFHIDERPDNFIRIIKTPK
jgi:hypothetical protein